MIRAQDYPFSNDVPRHPPKKVGGGADLVFSEEKVDLNRFTPHKFLLRSMSLCVTMCQLFLWCKFEWRFQNERIGFSMWHPH